MKVLFVELEMERDWAVASIGPAFLAAYIRQHGFKANLYNAPYQKSVEEIVNVIMTENPDILAFSLTTRQWLRAKAVANSLREKKHIPTIADPIHCQIN